MPPIRSLYVTPPPTQPTMGPVTTLQRLRDLYNDTLKDFIPADLVKALLPSQDVTMPLTTVLPGVSKVVTQEGLEALSENILKESNGKLAVLDLRRRPTGDVELETIATAPGQHGQGAGTEAMQKLTRWADESGVRLILSPSEKGYQPVEGAAKTTSTGRLKDFYSRFGFLDPTSRRHYDPTLSSPTRPVMYRPPQAAVGEFADQQLADPVKRTLKAYHGSPHDFDQFSLSKIGTGEGAQAYGHGLYFAENEGVAKQYRENLTASHPKFKHTDSDLVGGIANDRHDLPVRRAEIILAPTTSKEEALRTVEEGRSYLGDKGYSIAKNWIENGDVHWPQRTGRTYEVNIHASPDELLDWDKPLSQQPPKVQEAVKSVRMPQSYMGAQSFQGESAAHSAANRMGLKEGEYTISPVDNHRGFFQVLAPPDPNLEGSRLYDLMVSHAGGRAGHTEGIASQKLKDAGIKGIQYLDQGSRTAGEGTKNFVIFDDKIIEIAKKYGLSLPVAASLYKWQQSQKGVE